MERLGLTQSPSLLDRLASPSGNSAAPIHWIAPLGHADIAWLRRRSVAAALRSASSSFSAAALRSLVEKGGAKDDAGFKAQSTSALAVRKRAGKGKP
jgi:hypothetical protein